MNQAAPEQSSRTGPSVAQYHRAAERALEWLRRAPVLGLAAAAAAMLELVLARVGWHGLTDFFSEAELVQLSRWARFPRNLAALCGMWALAAGLISYLRLPGFAPIGRRLAVATFAGIFFPCLLAATFLPGPWLRDRLVVFGLAAGHVLVTLLAMSAVRYRSGKGLRAAIALATFTAFSVLLVVGIARLAEIDGGPLAPIGQALSRRPTATSQSVLFIRHAGEMAWCASLLAIAWRVFWPGGGRSGPPRWVGVVAISSLSAAILVYREITGHLFRVMLYGAFRLDLLRDDAPYLYALPLAAGLAAGVYALADRDANGRQLGAGALLWLAAGYGPHTPIQLLYLVLGAMLMVRAAQAYDPEGTWRERNPMLWLTVRYG